MHICLISEGSYPYVVGGVSSWTHMLINNMPEHDFTIITIYPVVKDKGVFKYDIPDNVREVRENFLDELSQKEGKYNKKYNDVENGLNQFKHIIRGEDIEWDNFFSFLDYNNDKSAQDFIMSKPFYNGMLQAYKENFDTTSLADFFWSVRSMSIPLAIMTQIEIPEADIYHCLSTGYAGILAAKAKITHNKPMLLTEHGIYTREREEEIIRADWVNIQFKDMWIKYFYSLSKCAYIYCDRAITLFEKAMQLQEEMGCDNIKQQIVSNGVNVDKFINLPREDKSNNQLVVGAIVRIVPIKDILTMLQAFRVVNQYFDNIKFYIMGPIDENPEYYDECMSIRRLLKLEHVVEFTSRVDVSDYIPRLDIAVLSSISEGQPLGILETMAAGIPNVTTNVGSCLELLYGNSSDTLGKAGIVVPIMDFEKMAEGIITILKDKNLQEEMSKTAKSRIQKHYRLADTISAYKNIYSELNEVY